MLDSRFTQFAFMIAAALSGHALAQDECTGAIAVVLGPNGPFTNVGSTTSVPAWPCGAGANDIWFVYCSPAAGPTTFDTCGGGYDSTIQVFSGTCGALVSLACNDDFCGLQSSVTIAAAACTRYFIRVGGFAGGTGPFPLNIAGPAGPACCGTPATVVPQGPGCLASYASFYEYFATSAAFDLAGTCITLTNTGSGYVVTPGGGVYNPVGSLAPAVPLVLTDDSQVAAGTLGLNVGSNGWVALAGGNSNSFVVSVPVMLANPATAFYSWHDMNPTIPGSGLVMYEELGVLAQVTYNGVWDFAGTTVADANNIQFQINTATGTVTICWGFMSALGASGIGHLVGYSPGGASVDPGGSNLSALGVIVTGLTDISPLTLTSVGTPVQGPVAVPFTVTTGNIPFPCIHVGIVGLARPGLPLFVIGMPGCFLNASLDVLVGPVVALGPTVTWTALTLPAAPPFFLGFQFNAQGAILGTPLNTAFGIGALSSNGLKCTVGDV